jgi:hypothetical protein
MVMTKGNMITHMMKNIAILLGIGFPFNIAGKAANSSHEDLLNQYFSVLIGFFE